MILNSALLSVLILFGTAVAVISLSHRLRIPPVIGFLVTGMAAGPFGFGIIHQQSQVETYAELGVVFLLFLVGLELSMDRLKRLMRIMVQGGVTQAVLTVAVMLLPMLFTALSFPKALFFGFLLIQSSTVVVMKLYQDREEMDSPHAEVATGILLFQDLFIVPLLLVLPFLAGQTGTDVVTPGRLMLNGLLLIAILGAVRFLLPYLLRFIAETRIHELFVLTAISLCLGAALLSKYLGFSLALGAFACGILLSSSRYHHQISAETAPFKDVFTSLFFIAIGMLINLHTAWEHLSLIVVLCVSVVVVKIAIGYVTVAMLRYPHRIRVLSGLGLAQIGEFAFILLQSGMVLGLVSGEEFQIANATAVLTLMLAPVLIAVAPRMSGWIRKGVEGQTQSMPAGKKEKGPQVVVIGFGLAGHHLARVLREAGIPYRVVEFNAVTVRASLAQNEPVLYGDAARADILEAAGVRSALVIVFVISDPAALRRSIPLARSLNPGITIVARTRRFSEIEALRKAGADEVVAEEFETSIELFTLVLTKLHIPRNLIRAQTRLLREDGYEMLRVPAPAKGVSEKVMAALAAGTTDTFYVASDHFASGKTLKDLNLRTFSGASVIAIVREERPMPNPPLDLPLQSGDTLVLVGTHAQIDAAFLYLEKGAPDCS